MPSTQASIEWRQPLTTASMTDDQTAHQTADQSADQSADKTSLCNTNVL
jgi:hypothetical protein